RLWARILEWIPWLWVTFTLVKIEKLKGCPITLESLLVISQVIEPGSHSSRGRHRIFVPLVAV
ncbi:hypothetical protein N9204_02575, partial [bacterium]|nr:hypothetical protein [bacterium]